MITSAVLAAATEQQLKTTQKKIVEELKHRKAVAQLEMKRMLKPGDKMKTKGLSPARHNGKTVTIIEVKKTRVTVQLEDEQASCTIPLQCLEVI